MFVDDEDSLAEKGDPPAFGLVAFDQASDGVAKNLYSQGEKNVVK